MDRWMYLYIYILRYPPPPFFSLPIKLKHSPYTNGILPSTYGIPFPYTYIHMYIEVNPMYIHMWMYL